VAAQAHQLQKLISFESSSTWIDLAGPIPLLVFRDTLLSFVASVQIQSHDVIKEGDWLSVPSYGAGGDVVNMSLHTVKVQNWDQTFTVIPTYKLMEVPYRNRRGMQERGGRV
jgi:miniconductance mechanosensitive channel